MCDRRTRACIERPSCSGLAATCGASKNVDCCASSIVPGGTFLRGFDGVDFTDNGYPATVSDFRLDTYEITVGRFRRFVAAYKQDMIPAGAGKNPNNPSDPGWDVSWTALLDESSAALVSAIESDPDLSTWKAGDDNLPMSTLTWYEAQAFCIWDGGRLPTDAEWNYAAAGGAQQRAYPWGNAAPDSAGLEVAAYGCLYMDTDMDPTTCGPTNIAPVGSFPAGAARWGQADMGGNVFEWSQDGATTDPNTQYILPCNDCSAPSGERSYRRGGSFSTVAGGLEASGRAYSHSDENEAGARCARGI